MQFVYVLKSRKNNKLYIGCTDNLERRLQEHNNGLVNATKPYITWQVVYSHTFLIKKPITGNIT